MSQDFTLIRGDTLPVMRVTVATNDGSGAGNVAFDCTGATVTLHGYGPDAIAWSYPMDLVTPASGIVAMNWTSAQTRALFLGLHHCWVTVVTPGGAKQTFPNNTNSISAVGIKLLVVDAP